MSTGTMAIRAATPGDCPVICAMGGDASHCRGLIAEYGGIPIGAVPTGPGAPVWDRALPGDATLRMLHAASHGRYVPVARRSVSAR